MSIWFTADQHFGHANIIRHTKRPFSSVHEMDSHLIAVWNERVASEDAVYHLGDLCWKGNPRYVRDLVEQLNGTIYLLRGNHDRKIVGELESAFGWVQPYYELRVEPEPVPPWILCHYAFETWNRSHYGAIHLHGHSHGGLARRSGRMDVGVDTRPDYAPYSLQEVEERLRRGKPIGDGSRLEPGRGP